MDGSATAPARVGRKEKVPVPPPPPEQRTPRSSRKDTAMGPEARDALDDGAPPNQVRLPPLMVLAHESKVGPAAFLMLRPQFHLQGGQCLQCILPRKLSRSPRPFLALLLHRLLFSSWEDPYCCCSSATISTSSMMSSAGSWNTRSILAASPSTRGSLFSTTSNLKRVASLPGITNSASKVPTMQSIRTVGHRPQHPEHQVLQLRRSGVPGRSRIPLTTSHAPLGPGRNPRLGKIRRDRS